MPRRDIIKTETFRFLCYNGIRFLVILLGEQGGPIPLGVGVRSETTKLNHVFYFLQSRLSIKINVEKCKKINYV